MTDLELSRLEERKKEIDKELKVLVAERKGLNVSTRKIKNTDRTRAAIFGNFFRKNYSEDYEQLIRSQEFEKYLNRNTDRELFGFPPLPVESEALQGKQQCAAP